jgi:hypothetical protein
MRAVHALDATDDFATHSCLQSNAATCEVLLRLSAFAFINALQLLQHTAIHADTLTAVHAADACYNMPLLC